MVGLGPIPWSSIIKWCQLNGIYDINEIDIFQRYIRGMEKAEYEFREKKSKGASKK